MEDPQLEGVNRGFAFIEFGTHKEALRAFRRLQQADAIFGTERSAKVAWAQPLNEPDEDTMSQVHSDCEEIHSILQGHSFLTLHAISSVGKKCSGVLVSMILWKTYESGYLLAVMTV